MSSHNCAVCGKSSELRCSSCKLISYCGKEHQKTHWNIHKIMCRPFEIIVDNIIGKCLIATRDLQPGDLILIEKPIVYGPRPHMVEDGPVPCVGCCRLINPESAFRCTGCDFPVCFPECPGLKDMEIHGYECLFLGLRELTALNGLHDFYRQDVLLALRCLLLQIRHPKKFNQLLQMEAHVSKRGVETEIYWHIEDRVVNYLHNNFFMPMQILQGKLGKNIIKDISKDTIQKICGIIDVNALEINQDVEVTALYPTAYLMEHNCLCNARRIFEGSDKGYTIIVKAAFPILKGEHISTMYTHSLWGTQARREHLMETKFFSCQCKRCEDPTELGTYLSALKCLNTKNGDLCEGIQLPLYPLRSDSEWTCNKCEVKLSNEDVCFLVNQIGEEVDKTQLSNPTVRELESLLSKMLNFLHQNHYHIYSVKHSLIQLYGYQDVYTLNQLSDDVLVRKASMCRDLLDITKKIDPVNVRLALYSGILLHELYLANMTIIKRKWDLGIKSKVKSINILLQECQHVLKQAETVIQYEKKTPAGEKLLTLVEGSNGAFKKFCLRNKIDITSKECTKIN